MAHINDLGRFYTQRLYWQKDDPPLIHFDRTVETVHPFRVGKCVVLRKPFSKDAYVFGAWVGKSQDEEAALLDAMGGRVTKDNGIRLTGEEDW